VWRAVSAPARNLQLVPEVVVKEAEEEAAASAATVSDTAAHSDLLLNLFHLNARASCEDRSLLDERDPKAVDSEPNAHGRIKVTRTLEDARPLTADEYRAYGPLVSRMRQNNPSNISSTGQPLAPSDASDSHPASAATRSPTHVLLSHRSPLLSTLRQLASSQQESLQPPVPAAPNDAAVPVIEQDTVLDLSRSAADRREEEQPQRLPPHRSTVSSARPLGTFPTPQPAHEQRLSHQQVEVSPPQAPLPTHEPPVQQERVQQEALPLLAQDLAHQPAAQLLHQQELQQQQLVPQQPAAPQAVLVQQQDHHVVPEHDQEEQQQATTSAAPSSTSTAVPTATTQTYRLADGDPGVVLQWTPPQPRSVAATPQREVPLAQQVAFGGRLLLQQEHLLRPSERRQDRRGQQQQPQNLVVAASSSNSAMSSNNSTMDSTMDSNSIPMASSSARQREELRQVRQQLLLEQPRQRPEPQAAELREALMRMQVASVERRDTDPPHQSVSLREALLRMNPEAVMRSDEIIARSQRQRHREFR
jgi:hypothetical protein